MSRQPDLLIQVDRQQFKAIDNMLGGMKRGTEKVLSRALNKVTAAHRTKIVRQAATETSLKQSVLREGAVTMQRANFKQLEAAIKIRPRRISLKVLDPRQTDLGVTYRSVDGGDRVLRSSAFIVKSLGGHVFKRIGRERLPIDKQFETFSADQLERLGIIAQAERELPGALEREIVTQSNVLIDQEARKAGVK